MLTPEIQTYIQQSRASGVPDAQIHSALSAQGWSEPDLNEAFGLPGAASTHSAAKIIAIVVLVIVLVPTLVGSAIAGYAYYSYKKSGFNLSTSGIYNSLPKTDSLVSSSGYSASSSQSNSSKTPGSAPACANVNSSTATLPEGWPSDIPVYPGSKLLGSVKVGATSSPDHFASVSYCTKDTADAVENFFIHSKSPWVFQNTFSSNMPSTDSGTTKQIVLSGLKSGEQNGLLLSISGDGSYTAINIALVKSGQ